MSPSPGPLGGEQDLARGDPPVPALAIPEPALGPHPRSGLDYRVVEHSPIAAARGFLVQLSQGTTNIGIEYRNVRFERGAPAEPVGVAIA